MANRLAQPGDRFGMLVVIDEAERARNGRRRVRCLCDCGKEVRAVAVSNLAAGNTRSCGCTRSTTLRARAGYLKPGAQAANFIFLNYQSNARQRGFSWSLSREQFDGLTAQHCHYCGTPPSNRTKDRNGDGEFVYNGLDRVDPTRGYEIDNVVPACIICNRAKTNMTLTEFAEWVQRVTVRLKGGDA